ncbi:hypothetical protein [Cellulomonas sp. NS3]|uniref:hypothetical protein n=1 Tax=Cellulomonas sp. NS3 TaxID=2973977 RepID=UPI0021615F16|nr:hypothetical protein [Cellulomonas sp. NS3]
MPNLPAYDLVLGTADDVRPPTPAALWAGWAGPAGPAIDPATWPRSPRTGQPLVHDATVALPESYRRARPDLVAVAIFDWADEGGFLPAPAHLAAALRGDRSGVEHPDDPFWADVDAARPHPQAVLACDRDTGAFYAAVWLTQDELTGPRTPRPRQGAQLDEDEPGMQADERTRLGLMGELWAVERVGDPHAGTAPDDSLWDPEDDEPEVDERFSHNHLGGTFMDPNGVGRRAPSPWYLEIHRLGGLWVGDDENLVLDLDDPRLFALR